MSSTPRPGHEDAPVTDSHWTTGEDVQAHAFRAVVDSEHATEGTEGTQPVVPVEPVDGV